MSDTTMHDDLREAVARAIYEAWNISGVPYDSESIRGNEFREGKALAQADAALAVIASRQPTRAEIWDAAMDYAAMTAANRTMGQNSIWSAAKSVGMEDEYRAISVAVEKRGWSARDDLLTLIDKALVNGGDDADHR